MIKQGHLGSLSVGTVLGIATQNKRRAIDNVGNGAINATDSLGIVRQQRVECFRFVLDCIGQDDGLNCSKLLRRQYMS